jgi:uncharacterized tellurite resistance protein B-like protein
MKEFQLLMDLAFGCIASDGDVAQVELDCLKSICIQRGISVQDYHSALEHTQSRFNQDLAVLYDSLIPELIEMSGDFEKQLDVFEMLIELVVSDGNVEQSELEFIRFVFQLGQWNPESIKKAKPNWSPFLQGGFETAWELREKVLNRMTNGVEKHRM